MTEARQLADGMERAYQQGDQLQARARARDVLAQSPTAEERAAAEAMLRRLEPDAFLLFVGVLGLGLTVWLVYNYVL